MAYFEVNKKPPLSFPTVSGAICTFNSQYSGLPLKSCTSLISGYQEGSGTPSPTNVRNLVSFSSANLYVSAENIIDINDAHITSQTFSSNFFLKAGTYTLSANYNNISNIIGYLRLNTRYEPITQLASLTLDANDSGRISASFTLENDSVCRLAFQGASTGYDFYVSNIMLEVGGSETSFEPYNGNSYTFTFGQSIYQGSIDWKRGVVVGTMAMVDLGSMTYYEYGSTDTVTQYYTNGLDLLAKSRANTACSIFSEKSTKLEWTSFIIATGSSGRTYFRTPKDYYSDATAFKTAMNGVMLAYELATPIEIPLGGIQLLTQEGQNNIWCDTGNTSLQYIKLG